ncbi:hypothetical protein [Ruminiclostridium papyrosolvens]|uniref:Uncharacterized protein n=1 Tax=Ruminiclostridium papyrosolvens C7 TaxID=1330534 RepID=U4R7G5_9FIRM|nr:hypothetical protein [Ruminiclostridium papyrosolvens]EPR14430.1 hypothetical protein L323_00265 [Ruminiclostridium papyrosolvens C7]
MNECWTRILSPQWMKYFVLLEMKVELKQILNAIVKILEGEVPKHLSAQIDCHGFMSLLYIVSHVMGYLNSNMILNIP